MAYEKIFFIDKKELDFQLVENWRESLMFVGILYNQIPGYKITGGHPYAVNYYSFTQ